MVVKPAASDNNNKIMMATQQQKAGLICWQAAQQVQWHSKSSRRPIICAQNTNNNNNSKSRAIILVCAFMFLCANNRNFNILTVMRMSKIYMDMHKKHHSAAFRLTLPATPAAWVLMGRGWVAGRSATAPAATKSHELPNDHSYCVVLQSALTSHAPPAIACPMRSGAPALPKIRHRLLTLHQPTSLSLKYALFAIKSFA